jgi:hypothetical protein
MQMLTARFRSILFACMAVALSVAPVTSQTQADEITAADLLPESTILYVEMPQPKQLIATVLDHQITKDIQATNEYKAATGAKQYRQFLAGVTLFESELGVKWRPAIEKLSGGGLYLAFDPTTEGAALLMKSSDVALLEKFRDTFIKLARMDAAGKAQPDPIRQAEYRGVPAFRIGQGRFATVDGWLFLVNKDDLGKRILDAYLDLNESKPGSNSLTNSTQFQTAHAAAAKDRTAWGYVNLEVIRNAGVAKELFSGKTENPGAEVLIGGVMDTLKNSPYATATLTAKPSQLGFALSLPHKAEWVTEAREYFFGEKGKGTASALLRPKDTLLSLSTYRNLAAMWAAADDLYDENAAAELAKADSNLSTLFAGRDFGNEILGAAGPELQFVLTRQKYEDVNVPTPAIKLPAGALVVSLINPEIARQFKVTFQSVIGLVNFGQSQQGSPQFELSSEKRDGGEIVSAVYLVDKGAQKDGEGLIQYNASPTIAFVKDKLILSSAKSLASELMDLLKKDVTATKDAAVNTQIMADLKAVGAILKDNQKHLVAQNMLEKGHGKDAAEREIGTFLKVIDYFNDASIRLTTEAEKLELNFEVNIKK